MRTLVTGGTGFIGSEVARQLLEAGQSVRIFSRRKDIPAPFTGNVEIAQGDLGHVQSLVDALVGIEVLYHIGEIRNTSKAASEKNVLLMQEMLGRIKETGLRRIVFISSITVSGIPSSVPADEDTVPEVVLHDHYTDGKRRSEKLLLKSTGSVEYVIVRPAPVYGFGSRYLGRLISTIDRFGPVGIPFPGNADSLAPLVHIRDLGRAIVTAGREPAAAGQIFNLTDGCPHSWRDFLQEIADSLGKKLRIVPIPQLLLQVAALPLDLASGLLGINLDPVSYAAYFSKDLFFDNTKAKKLLNWEIGYPLSAGVKEMTAFYLKKK